jgi:REP element-mobilizing transposase RayT
MKQPRLIPIKSIRRKSFGEVGLAFGGSLLKNSHAKSERPFSPRAAIHVVLRARAPFTLLKRGRRKKIAEIVTAQGKRHFVQIHRFANAGNHLHMLIECREKAKFRAFLKAVTGAIALFVKVDERRLRSMNEEGRSRPEKPAASRLTVATKAPARASRPWTRLVAASGRAFVQAWRYIDLNALEGACWGITRHEARSIQYGDLGPPRAWLKI